MNVYEHLKVFKYFFETTTLTKGWFTCTTIDFQRVKSKEIEHLELTNYLLRYLYGFPKTINKLYVHYNKLAGTTGLFNINELIHWVDGCKNWKVFGLYSKHSNVHLVNPVTPELVSKLVGRSQLEELKLSIYCKNAARKIKNVNDMNIMELLETQEDLKVVKLDSFKSITEATVLSLVDSCKKIKELSLDYSKANDEVLYSIADNLKDTLQQLSLAETILKGVLLVSANRIAISKSIYFSSTKSDLLPTMATGIPLALLSLISLIHTFNPSNVSSFIISNTNTAASASL
jgi:hypothetical protein